MYYADQLPSLLNYNTARNWYDTRKAYKRGRSKGLYPLGDNRRYDRSLISIGVEHGGVENGGREFVICSYHGTNVITFYSDNSIVINNGGYETIATEDFINSILRNRFAEGRVVYGSLDHGDGVREVLAERKPKWSGIIRRKGKMYFSDGYGKDHRFERILKIAANNEVTGGVVEKRLELNQELMGKLRKHYAEFTEYLTYYVQMIGDRHAGGIASPVNKLSANVSDIRWGLDKERANRTMFFHRLHEAMKIGKDEGADETADKDAKDAKLNEFLSLAEEVVINASMKYYDYKMAQYFYRIDPQRARDHFYEVCRYYYAKFLFSYKEVEMGKVVLNENKKYMDYASQHATLALPF
jgi:hypothetical protein